MKLLLDSCVWGGAVEILRAAGHEVDWTGSWPSDPGDTEILERAHADGCILVTLDKDFGELAVVRDVRHSGIIRVVGFTARMQAQAVLHVLASHAAELVAGALVTVDPRRIRVRPR